MGDILSDLMKDLSECKGIPGELADSLLECCSRSYGEYRHILVAASTIWQALLLSTMDLEYHNDSGRISFCIGRHTIGS